MPNISQEPATDTPRRTDGKICERTIEGTEPQPRFRRQLQGPAEKIANDIGMTHNNFEFMLRGSFFFVCREFGLSIKVFGKGLFDARMILVCDLNDFFRGRSPGGNVMTRATFVQIGIGFEVGYALNVFGDNVGCFFGACHVGDAQG